MRSGRNNRRTPRAQEIGLVAAVEKIPSLKLYGEFKLQVKGEKQNG